MAFPVLVETAATSNGTATTTPAITLPDNLATGQLLIVYLFNDYNITENNTPTGWTELHQSEPTSAMRCSIFWKVSEGDEGTELDFTSGNVEYSGCAFSFNDHDSSTNPPEIATATASFGTQDPPSLTPGGGSLEYKWLAQGSRDANTTAYSPPSGYTELVDFSGSGAPSISVAHLDVEASAENPGTFTNSTSGVWLASTIAIYPGSEGGATGPSVFPQTVWM